MRSNGYRFRLCEIHFYSLELHTFFQIVLNWCSSQNNTPFCLDLIDRQTNCRFAILNHVPLITDDQVRA